jgi:hypothetical protein
VHVLVEYLGESVVLPYGETSVGRDISCSLRFNDPAVSRKHLRLIRREDEVFLEDLSSANGTLLNGRKLGKAVKLHDGDVIRFGSRELTIHITDTQWDERSTLTLKADALERETTPPPALKKMFGVPVHVPRARTQPMIAVVPPPTQKCPKCAAPVTELDDECPNCRFNWGSFRPMSRTDMIDRSTMNLRIAERHAVELRLVYSSQELEIEAVTRDLSESGVFVCSQVLDPVGTACHLTILIDGGPPLAIEGVVRRVVTHTDDVTVDTGLGVQFKTPGAAELAWIRAVIARMAEPDAG